MKHTLAHQTNTIDKYLLNEFTLEERLAFEEHMFDCPECAAKVQEEFAMLADLKSVLQEPIPQPIANSAKAWVNWRAWFTPMSVVPACAALALACIVGYQNTVSIPNMLEPQVLDTTPIMAATRGATTQYAIVKPGAALFAASFEVVSPSVYPSYVCEFQADGGGRTATIDCGKHPTAEFTLNLLLPSAKFPAGGYTMILRPSSDPHAELSRYSFNIKRQGQ